jgi:hypothetical protein
MFTSQRHMCGARHYGLHVKQQQRQMVNTHQVAGNSLHHASCGV